jgi:hypothetical protein
MYMIVLDFTCEKKTCVCILGDENYTAPENNNAHNVE